MQTNTASTAEQLLQTALDADAHNPALVKQFFDKALSAPRYVIGRNAQASAVIEQVVLDGVIDDYSKLDQWQGVPIVSLAQVPSDAIVVNCSTSISPISVLVNLHKAGITRVLNYCDLLSAANADFQWPDFVQDMRADLDAHRQQWLALFDLMADETSRQVLLDVMRYRLSAQPAYMTQYSVRFRDQYFEDFLQLKEEVFVDAGGFDGDTSEEFIKRYPDYRAIYLFEPSPPNLQAAKVRLKAYQGINLMQLGLSDAAGTLFFNAEAGSASAVSDAGGQSIEVTTLDEAVADPVSFIKMDLEGWEMKALAGCREHILRDRPKLAISVYHSAEDFRLVPAFITNLMPDCRVYLRHYTEGWSETVMYFVPTS